ncbi:MAG: hypothetical protein AAB965_01290, partial [Patescibacteria group bacterium]
QKPLHDVVFARADSGYSAMEKAMWMAMRFPTNTPFPANGAKSTAEFCGYLKVRATCYSGRIRGEGGTLISSRPDSSWLS